MVKRYLLIIKKLSLNGSKTHKFVLSLLDTKKFKKNYRYAFKHKKLYWMCGEVIMKRQNCPFCGHRWVRSSEEIEIVCPNCKKSFTEEEYLEMRALYEED